MLLAGLTHRRQALRCTASVQLTLRLRTGGRVIADNPPLLTQRPEVRDGPVVHHTEGEVNTGNSEDDREDVHNHLLLTEHRGVQSSLRHVLHAQLLLNVELGGTHHHNHDGSLNHRRGGVTGTRVHHGRKQLSTENLGVVELVHQFSRQHEHALVALRRGGNTHQHLVQTEEDWHLSQNRQAGCEGVRTVLTVHFHLLLSHRLAGELVLLTLVLLLQLRHIALHRGHTAHSLNLLDEQRDGQGTHHQSQEDDAQNPGQAGGGVHTHRGEQHMEQP